MSKKEIGIYIHIPFCKQKCYYCDFVSFANCENRVEEYVDALCKEIDSYNLEEYEVTSIYFGGGTPSFIDSKFIGKIMSKLKVPKNCETTIEVNPGTVDRKKLLEVWF